jgi:hypothetical protein
MGSVSFAPAIVTQQFATPLIYSCYARVPASDERDLSSRIRGIFAC